MSEWKEYKLGELTLDGKGHYGIAAPAVDFDCSKYTYLRITDINDDGTINRQGLKSVDDVKAKEYLLKPNDIVFARTGASVGRSYFYDGKDGELVYAGFLIKFSLNPEKVCPYILKAYTHSQEYYDWIRAVDNGATRGNINAQTFASMPISLPSLEEQKRIAGVLSSLDDKIDLLNRENATLEALAETLFCHYFIETPNPTWKEGKLGELINIGSGKALKHSGFVNEGLYPVLGANGAIGRANEYLVNETDRVLYTGRVGTLGKVFRLEGERAWLSDNTLVIKPKCHFNYVYFLLKQANLQDLDVGSTQPLIRQSDVVDIDVIIPNDSIIDVFEKEVSPLFEKIKSNQQQIQTLTIQRDSLLPHLMSGEVKISGQYNIW